jgi:hypothetical protein
VSAGKCHLKEFLVSLSSSFSVEQHLICLLKVAGFSKRFGEQAPGCGRVMLWGESSQQADDLRMVTSVAG